MSAQPQKKRRFNAHHPSALIAELVHVILLPTHQWAVRDSFPSDQAHIMIFPLAGACTAWQSHSQAPSILQEACILSRERGLMRGSLAPNRAAVVAFPAAVAAESSQQQPWVQKMDWRQVSAPTSRVFWQPREQAASRRSPTPELSGPVTVSSRAPIAQLSAATCAGKQAHVNHEMLSLTAGILGMLPLPKGLLVLLTLHFVPPILPFLHASAPSLPAQQRY